MHRVWRCGHRSATDRKGESRSASGTASLEELRLYAGPPPTPAPFEPSHWWTPEPLPLVCKHDRSNSSNDTGCRFVSCSLVLADSSIFALNPPPGASKTVAPLDCESS